MSLSPPTHQPCTCAITGLGERHRLNELGHRALVGGGEREVLAGVPHAVGGEHGVPVVKAAAEVEARAERALGAAQQDHLHLRVGARAVDRRFQLIGHRRHDRVQPLGPVQRDRRDRFVGVVS
ncbi:MAG TPA: hypothetical protein VK790_11135 [Solirubrobacteraceae bacterium]|nr:hypothetical protein [Solirubrobacteraceae bacterium]